MSSYAIPEIPIRKKSLNQQPRGPWWFVRVVLMLLGAYGATIWLLEVVQ